MIGAHIALAARSARRLAERSSAESSEPEDPLGDLPERHFAWEWFAALIGAILGFSIGGMVMSTYDEAFTQGEVKFYKQTAKDYENMFTDELKNIDQWERMYDECHKGKDDKNVH